MKSKNDVTLHKDTAIKKIDTLITKYINSGDSILLKKADLLSYWLESYAYYINNENTFKPEKLIRYKRGSIIKANLGFNIGSEEGGLHYCIVLDNDNNLTSPIITVLPLCSIKPNKPINPKSVNLGDSLYSKLLIKVNAIIKEVDEQLNEFNKLINDVTNNEFESMNNFFNNKTISLNNIKDEILKMNLGSIALINQITSISKQRIYVPKNRNDVLYNISLDVEEMELINDAIIKNYIHIKK